MKSRLLYNHAELKQFIRSAGLSDREIAPLVKVQRLQVARCLNNISASPLLIQRLVEVANNYLGEQAQLKGELYQPLDWRTFLLERSDVEDEKILLKNVS